MWCASKCDEKFAVNEKKEEFPFALSVRWHRQVFNLSNPDETYLIINAFEACFIMILVNFRKDLDAFYLALYVCFQLCWPQEAFVYDDVMFGEQMLDRWRENCHWNQLEIVVVVIGVWPELKTTTHKVHLINNWLTNNIVNQTTRNI